MMNDLRGGDSAYYIWHGWRFAFGHLLLVSGVHETLLDRRDNGYSHYSILNNESAPE
jgi:hypothetical protein